MEVEGAERRTIYHFHLRSPVQSAQCGQSHEPSAASPVESSPDPATLTYPVMFLMTPEFS